MPSQSRKDFAEYLGWLDLDVNHSDPIAMLALSSGDGSLPVQLDVERVVSLLELPFTDPDRFWKLP